MSFLPFFGNPTPERLKVELDLARARLEHFAEQCRSSQPHRKPPDARERVERGVCPPSRPNARPAGGNPANWQSEDDSRGCS